MWLTADLLRASACALVGLVELPSERHVVERDHAGGNPATGGPVLSRLDCFLLGLSAGAPTRRYRTTSNAVCFAVEGAGSSTIGDVTIKWQKNDIFTLPHWSWISHTASSDTAIIFLSTDRDVMERLNLLREEFD